MFELRRADPAAGFAELTRGALAVGRDHVAASVNTLFLAYAGASLPLLVLFVSGGDPLGTVVTAEAVAVEVVRTLCGSVGLIAAVPLTTVLAANLALEEPVAARGGPPVTRGGPATPAGDGRVRYSPARGLDAASAGALFGQVLGLHGPALSEAVVGVAPGDSGAVEALPEGARQAAGQLRRLAAAARREGTSSWYRRAREAGTVRLDPADPGQLKLLRRFGGLLGRHQGLGRGRPGAGGGDDRQLRRPAPCDLPAGRRRAGPPAGRAGPRRPGRGDPDPAALPRPPPLTAPGR